MKIIKSFLAVINFMFLISVSTAYASDTVKLRVATFNIGMLNKVRPVPYLKERGNLLSSEIYKTLLKKDIDVLAIQEAWLHNLKEGLKDPNLKYTVLTDEKGFTLPFLEHSTGMLFVVKKSLEPKADFKSFAHNPSYICLWGLVCKRGTLKVQITKDKKIFYLLNSHLSPTPELTHKRKEQFSSISSTIKELSVKSDGVIFLGDTNVSVQFGELKERDHGSNKVWRNNGRLYKNFIEQNKNCQDTYKLKKAQYTFTMNREQNLTALVSPSAGRAPSQRNDWIIACSGNKSSLKTTEHHLVFTKTYKTNGTGFHLSDHFGVFAEVEFK